MKARSFVRIVVAAIVLVVLFGASQSPAQAKMNAYTPFRVVEKRTTLVDTLTMTASGLSIVPVGSAIDLFSSRPPLQVSHAEPLLVPDWVMLLTVVVIVLSASAGAVGTRLTRTMPPGAGKG